MKDMITIPFIISIIISASIGTFPIFGPFVSGFSAGVIIGKRNTAIVAGFLGSIIGGVFCRIFLLYPNNIWHFRLLNSFGSQIGKYLEVIIRGNIFFSALYFGLLAILGGLIGSVIIIRVKQ